MASMIPLDYGEGWNVVHTLRFLNGKSLYVPLTALPITPVNYPPLSFFIIGGISCLTGSVLVTGRVVSLISLIIISYQIYRILVSLVLDKTVAWLGMFLWLTLMVSVAEKYVGAYNPQMLAHVFSLGALCLYIELSDELSHLNIILIAFLCCIGLFIKHLVIPIPLSIALMLFISKRRLFWVFTFVGVLISSLMFFGSWLYGSNDFLSNFLDLDRQVSYQKAVYDIMDVFFSRSTWIIFLPFFILVFAKPKGIWV
jgi:hypothetical protein